MLRLCSLAVFVGVVGSAASARADVPDPWLSRDKAFHFDVSAGIAAVGYAASAAWLVNARWKALAFGGALAIAAGAGKEIVDATGVFGGDGSWKDFTWDAIGAVAGLAIACSVDLLLGGVDGARPALGSPRATSLTIRF
jgi:putative lipoprotein